MKKNIKEGIGEFLPAKGHRKIAEAAEPLCNAQLRPGSFHSVTGMRQESKPFFATLCYRIKLRAGGCGVQMIRRQGDTENPNKGA